MERKYEFTGETKRHCGATLHQIRALRSFGVIAAGEVGGWIESESNLSHDGLAWVSNEAQVCGEAMVHGEAQVYGKAMVHGKAQVCGEAQVYGKAMVHGEAMVHGKAQVSNEAMVHGEAWVYGNSHVCGEAQVCGEAMVHGEAWVYGKAMVRGKAQVYGNAWVHGEAMMHGEAMVYGNAQVYGDAQVSLPITSATRTDGYTFVCAPTTKGDPVIIAGCRYFTIPAAREHWARTRGGTPLGDESLAIVDHLERMAKIQGWIV